MDRDLLNRRGTGGVAPVELRALTALMHSLSMQSAGAWITLDRVTDIDVMAPAAVRGLVGHALDEEGDAYRLIDRAKQNSHAAPVLFRPWLREDQRLAWLSGEPPARVEQSDRVDFRITLLPHGADAVAVWADLAVALEQAVKGAPFGRSGVRVTGGGIRWETMATRPDQWWETTDGHAGKALLCLFSPLHLREPRPVSAPGNSRGKQDRPLVRPETLTLGLLARAAVQRLRDVARNGPATAVPIELPWDPFVAMAQQTIVVQKRIVSEVASRESANNRGHRVDLSGITGMLQVEHQPPSLQALWNAVRFIGIGEHCSEGNGQVVSFS